MKQAEGKFEMNRRVNNFWMVFGTQEVVLPKEIW